MCGGMIRYRGNGCARNGRLHRPSRTRARDGEAASEAERERRREAELVGQLAAARSTARYEALGYDRHWARYWLLGDWGGPGAGARTPLADTLDLGFRVSDHALLLSKQTSSSPRS